MTQLTEEMFQIFDQPEFSFKKIKMQHSEVEVAELKDEFKGVWQTWKAVNQAVAQNLPTGKFAKVHVKNWTNGWNLRDHYWASYRLQDLADANPCVGIMLDKKQLQVYLMFQHYQSENRKITPEQYNEFLADIPSWSKQIDLQNWYIWNGEMSSEFDDHTKLSDYLKQTDIQKQFKSELSDATFLVGKFIFRDQQHDVNMEDVITNVIVDLLPLYEKSVKNKGLLR